ncbi:TonB-dependent receptor [Pseudoalteromonas xiamenensis]|uniref:TonB-dependent receptor n=1 Tax=Pseudoalteromonas xiamenensis TaxID=882626 RepID=UPI0027E54F70|nr:TonB-dependent receptor [Pseudoalteromonas xiamenensis]WMN60475.1 TonB-dependent receptor [Pseudoalteromonas xiamenensis]
MKKFPLSLLALACSGLSQYAIASKGEVSTTDKSPLEVISVYAKQNQVVMNSGLATKSDMSLMETPAAVVIVDGDLIKAQGISDLQDVIRNISGVTQAGNNYGIGDNLVIRGLGANYTFDGMYGGAGLGNTFNPTRSMTNVESVEVLKGPATGLYGMGSAGGVINLIEKKPKFQAEHAIRAEIGQWNTYSVELDSTDALTDDVAYRILVKSARSDGYRDLSNDRDEVYASLKFVLNSSNNLLLSAAYIDDAIAVDSIGHPIRIFNSASVDGKLASQVTWQDLVSDAKGKGVMLSDTQRQQLADSLATNDGLTPYQFGHNGIISPMAKDNEGQELRLKLTHTVDITDHLFLNHQLQYRDYDSSFARQTGAYNYVYWQRGGVVNADPRAPLVVDGELYPFAARRQEYRKVEANESSLQYFADLRYDFSIGNVNNEFLVNANYEDRDIRFKQYSIYDADQVIKNKQGDVIYQGTLPYIFDIRNPNWATSTFEDNDPLKTADYNKTVAAWGLGAQHVAYFENGFTTRVGLAFNRIKQSYQHFGVDARYRASAAEPKPEQDTSDSGITYNLGASYKFSDDVSAFINHSKGRTAYSILGEIFGNEADREDSESVSNDIGMRFKGFEDQVVASVVMFESSRTNLQYANPDYEAGVSAPSVPKSFYDGQEQTKGIELDLNAVLSDQWKFNFNAVYQDARDKQNPTSSSYNSRQKGVPYVTVGSWLTHSRHVFDLPAPVDLSLGMSFVDKRSTHSDSFGIPDGFVPSYTVFDAGVRYEHNNWQWQMNINNLFNKVYFSKAMFLGGMPGNERNVKLQVRYAF